MYKPERVSSSGKGVAAVTSATRVRFALGGTIYIVWVPGKEVKTPFYLAKKKSYVQDTIQSNNRICHYNNVNKHGFVCDHLTMQTSETTFNIIFSSSFKH